MKKIVVGLGWILMLLSSTVRADYSQHPQALLFIDEMVNQYGFDRDQLLEWMEEAEYQQSIINAISKPAEKVKPWKDYRKIFLTQDRIEKGKEFWDEQQEQLLAAQEKFQIPAETIVAIIGVETTYGRNKGSYRVFDALSTLAFDYPPRSEFFRKELREFLLLSREEFIEDPFELKGSYAGAMGYGQFMPSSFRAYAVDFDGDGKRDIWNNPADAIGSVANYLNKHGWKFGERVVIPADVQGQEYQRIVSNGLEPNVMIEQAQKAGVRPLLVIAPNEMTLPMALEGEDGTEVWLGLKNFQVITTYNRSQLYAMAVFQLSQAVKE